MKRPFRTILLAFTAGLILAAAGCGTSPGNSDPGADPAGAGGRGPHAGGAGPTVSVKAQIVTRGDVATFIMASTTLDAVRSVDVYAKATGIAMAVNFEEGDLVPAGKVLIKLDDREIRNEYTQADLAVRQAEIALEQAKVRKEQAASDYKRNSDLFKENLVSSQEYEKSKLDDEFSRLASDNADYDLKVARERYAAAKIQLENTEIMAPIDGVVTERPVELGDMIKVNDKVAALADMSLLLARVHVPETELHRIREGLSARIEPESMPGKSFTGTVKLISPTIDSTTGTGKVTLEIRDASHQLKPGMFVNVYLTTSMHQDVVKVLRKAIWHEKEEDWAFVIGPDNKVQKRKVTLGYTEEPWVEVVSGLNAGDKVVTVGQDSLDEGFSVQVAAMEGAGPEESRTGPPPPVAPPGDPAGAEMMKLMQNPAVRAEVDKKRQTDPETFRDPEKRRIYFKSLAEKYGNK
jgi:membrane fusion protein (multidrug efflux system)